MKLVSWAQGSRPRDRRQPEDGHRAPHVVVQGEENVASGHEDEGPSATVIQKKEVAAPHTLGCSGAELVAVQGRRPSNHGWPEERRQAAVPCASWHRERKKRMR